MADHWVPLMLVFPLAGSVLVLFGKIYKRAGTLFSVLGLAACLGTLASLFFTSGRILSGDILRYSLGGWSEPFGITLILDGFAWISVGIISVISLLVGLFAAGEAKYRTGFFFYYLILIAGMTGVALTGDLFTMFVSFEIVAISAYVLIAYEQTATGLAASFKYLILSSVGILFFLFGIFLLYRDLGTLSITDIAARLKESEALRTAPAIHLAMASLCVGIGVRTAFIPFHTWLPEAHAYAPHPVSALLSGVLIKVSFFAMVRLVTQFGGEYLSGLLLWTGALTAILAVISALAQSDAKRLLAFHSVSQMGYILAVFGAGSPLALTAAFFHAINHALFKSLLFLTVGMAVKTSGERNLYRINPMGKRHPVFAAAFFIGAFSIAGMPPFNGFASKAFITQGLKHSPAYILIWITSFLTIASFIKLSRIFMPGAGRSHQTAASAPEKTDLSRPGIPAVISVVLLSILCLMTGIFGTEFGKLLHGVLNGLSTPYFPEIFSPGKLASVLPLLVSGIGVFLMLRTSPGKKAAEAVGSLNPDLNSVLSFFFVGLMIFAVVAY